MRALIVAVLALGACVADADPEHVAEAAASNVACASAADCGSVPVSECSSWSCVAGVCVLDLVAARTPVAAQVAGDCSYAGCGGDGYVTQWYDREDVVDDGNPCTEDRCEGYAAKHIAWPVGSSCGNGLACNAAAQCAPVCADGIQDGAETDVDCGGLQWPACARCAAGKKCTQASDCASWKCSGVCLL